jgi:pyruvate/2-oxoglutarate dehydrogenase complex dihydrolipoamide acyltransferase (E2) component
MQMSCRWRRIEKAIMILGVRARDGKLKMEEMSGGTFTITNGGRFRLAALDADPEHAAIRYSRYA